MVKINFSNRQRKVKLPPNTRTLVNNACAAALKTEGVDFDSEINVTFVGDKKIRSINSQFRDIDRSTDVLSFPLGEDGVYDQNPENGYYMLGDVIISIDHALAQADFFGHGIDREIAYLVVHSVFHLLGYDHVDEGEDKKLMRAKEEDALKLLGLEII